MPKLKTKLLSLCALLFSPQCPKVVVTEAPPAPIPTPTPTAVEQQRGPQTNCSCPSGEKVKPPGFADLYRSQSRSATAFREIFCSVYLSQGDTGAPGVAGPKGEKVI